MSRIVDDSVFGSEPNPGQFTEKYPYDEWLDEKPRILVRGVDFGAHLTVEGLRNTFKRGIEKKGYRMRFKVISNDEVAVQALWR